MILSQEHVDETPELKALLDKYGISVAGSDAPDEVLVECLKHPDIVSVLERDTGMTREDMEFVAGPKKDEIDPATIRPEVKQAMLEVGEEMFESVCRKMEEAGVENWHITGVDINDPAQKLHVAALLLSALRARE